MDKHVPVGMSDELYGCPFIHDDIDRLFNVSVMPIDELPKVCSCGAKLTYADTVAFITEVEVENQPAMQSRGDMPYYRRR